MKIAYFTSMYPTPASPNGGVFITKRIEALARLGHEFELYAIVYKKTGIWDALRPSLPISDRPAIKAPGSSILYRPIEVKLSIIDRALSRLTGFRHQAKKTKQAIVAQAGIVECDLVHVHWLYPTGAAVLDYARGIKKPCVITCHGSDVNVFPNKLFFARRPARQTLEGASSVEFVSDALRRKAITLGYSDSHSAIISNGIDLADAQLKIELESASTDQLSVLKPAIVGFVGNLIPIKRADRLPAIIKLIEAQYGQPVEFHIIGEGRLRPAMEAELSENKVRFWGRISHDDVLKQMRQMSVLMLPSRNEGWPCVVLEAHSCGLPVVGSCNGGVPEAIGDDRLAVDETDFEVRFAQRVVDVLRGEISIDKEMLVERSLNYTWDKLAQQTMNNYLSVLK